ncbi:hypothetical protein N4Q66_26270, partial [Leclercia adecarboxylata]|uniref:GlgB N-terminal domain-containing protein n=1 Tax=Leclercia adecarboxylata TaxID=83655 RepID=UPI00234C1CBD
MTALDFATPTNTAAQPAAPVVLPPGVDQMQVDVLTHGRLGDPFAVLGPHRLDTEDGPRWVVRAFYPGARRVQAIDSRGQIITEMDPIGR